MLILDCLPAGKYLERWRPVMTKDPLVELVVSEVGAPLAMDGGATVLVGVAEGVAHVSYRPGHNEECPECVMSAEDMREYLREALNARAPYIRDVEIVAVP
jgi:Fe-S cluster biogenesis protein NfuA